jgi:hypothetical protein
MRFIAAIVLGFALMVGTADAGHHCNKTKCTPVRSVVSGDFLIGLDVVANLNT